MKTRFCAMAVVVVLVGCTHASISSIPMEIEGVGTVYRYQGRANFSHQIAEADRLITEDCKARNGGRPVLVDVQKRDLGVVAASSGQATTRLNATATGNTFTTGNPFTTGNLFNANVAGTATTTSSGSATAMRNYNQEILYKCVTE